MQLEFINHSAGRRELSDAERRTIRSVSRKVGAVTRKRRGLSAKNNLLQMPDFLCTPDAVHAYTDPPRTSTRSSRNRLSAPCLLYRLQQSPQSSVLTSIPRSLSLGPPPTVGLGVLMRPGFAADLLRYGAAADADANPRRWVKLCRMSHESVFEALPRLYGHSKCLDRSIECVAWRVQCCLSRTPESQLDQRRIGELYARAIRSLSAALAPGKVDWTVWYTTLLLVLFEVLDFTSHRAWILHARGALDVLEALGPETIVAGNEKTMFIVQAELMVLETVFANAGVFLDKPAWQKALKSTILPGTHFGDRSEPVVTLCMVMAAGPRLFHRATTAIMTQAAGRTDELVHKLKRMLARYTGWGSRWIPELMTGQEMQVASGVCIDPESMRRAELLTRYLAFLALINRFLSAIQPHLAFKTEKAAANAASQVIQITEFLPIESILALRMRLALRIAQSIQSTSSQWLRLEQQGDSTHFETVTPALFSDWCALLGRATGDDKSCHEIE